MQGWEREIVELHEFFEGWFLGTRDDLDRVEVALAPQFTMAGPDGTVAARSETIAAIEAGFAHTESLRIRIEAPELIVETDELVVAEYVEVHELADRTNRRRTTVVFRRDATAPNGLQWLRAQETWIDRGLG